MKLSSANIIRMFLTLLIIISSSGCSDKIDCDAYSVELSIKNEPQLFIDRRNDRGAFHKIIKRLQTELDGTDKAFSLLTNEKTSPSKVLSTLDEHGPILLSLATAYGDVPKVKFYLENGVDSLQYHKHVGVLNLDLIEFPDHATFEAFKSYFEKQQIHSEIFYEIENFYNLCVS